MIGMCPDARVNPMKNDEASQLRWKGTRNLNFGGYWDFIIERCQVNSNRI
jgi:hypothetical protein